MLPRNSAVGSERVLIHAPFGRDGALIQSELRAAGFLAVVCTSLDELCASMSKGAGAALVGDEALVPAAVQCLSEQLANQPPWSDLPLLVMTSGGASTDASRYRLGLLGPLGNITLLERPLRPVTLVSSLHAALRARRHQYQLREHLEELTRVNRELEEFAYVASHDLQEPLRMVKIYTQLILKSLGSGDETLSRYADFVEQGAGRMEDLIRDLLSFSRAVHTESAAVGTADLSASLAEAMAVLKSRIEESGAVVKAQGLPTVRGDTKQLAHVFQNLIANSIKYSKAGDAPEIHISADQRDGQWIIAVRDNGIGFEQQYAERIFGLFKRLHKDEYPGTGLGLAICKRIVERYGGRMWGSGKVGEGSTFYFALPPMDVS